MSKIRFTVDDPQISQEEIFVTIESEDQAAVIGVLKLFLADINEEVIEISMSLHDLRRLLEDHSSITTGFTQVGVGELLNLSPEEEGEIENIIRKQKQRAAQNWHTFLQQTPGNALQSLNLLREVHKQLLPKITNRNLSAVQLFINLGNKNKDLKTVLQTADQILSKNQESQNA